MADRFGLVPLMSIVGEGGGRKGFHVVRTFRARHVTPEPVSLRTLSMLGFSQVIILGFVFHYNDRTIYSIDQLMIDVIGWNSIIITYLRILLSILSIVLIKYARFTFLILTF